MVGRSHLCMAGDIRVSEFSPLISLTLEICRKPFYVLSQCVPSNASCHSVPEKGRE
jgi:hypothetical protein